MYQQGTNRNRVTEIGTGEELGKDLAMESVNFALNCFKGLKNLLGKNE